MCNFISPVEGAGWETTVRQGICCCKVAGALQHFTQWVHIVSPLDALVSETQASTPDSTIDTFPPTIIDVYKSMNKIKVGKAPGVCSIYPEYIQHGGSDALRTLHKIVTQVWKEEVVPVEWHQGIIIPLYKGKGSKSECSNYRGITLLSVPCKVFAHYHSCKNQTNIVVTQASLAKRIHAWSLYVRSHSNLV